MGGAGHGYGYGYGMVLRGEVETRHAGSVRAGGRGEELVM